MRSTVARAVALAVLLPCAAQAEVFVNEIHYDDSTSAGDVNEAIEVVATAGEDLSAYSLVLYNGSNGTTYDTKPLAGAASVSCGANVSVAFHDFTASGGQVQNGSPDGVALVGPGSTVIQFLSYEGSFTATNGPANGLLSVDIGKSETNGTAPGTSLQLTGASGTGYADFTWQASAAATFGACNTGQSFGAPVDNPPTVVASVPADGGSLPANQPLSVTFSETVQFGADWFQLACSTSGTFEVADATVSGGPTSYGIDPNGDLAEGESCTLLLASAAILDVDGDPDALAGDNEIAFTVGAPVVNTPPQVVSTVPTDGASSFPSAGDLSVTFSEPVDIASGAFSLTCATSTGVVLSYPASGTTVSIDTGTALVHEDTCTFSIDETLITDPEGAQLTVHPPVNFTVASNANGAYYDQVNDSSPEQLRCTLHQTIEGHTRYPYTSSSTDTWDILNLADEDPVDSSKILDAYRNASYTKITGGTGVYNREHTWPNTYGFSGGDPGPYTDTHMLYLTDTGYNSDRGSKPFADCNSGCTEKATVANHGSGGGGGGDSNWVAISGMERDGSFEVWDHRKGDMARTIMYMAIRYEGGTHPSGGAEPDLELTDTRSLITSVGSGGKHYMGLLTHVLAWHAADPPDARELARNEVIYSFQNNRNPFIDHPEWGTLALFQSSQPAECILGTPSNGAPVAVDDAYAATQDVPLIVPAATGVLANDSDPDADALTAQLLANAANGIVSLATDGSFTYTANASFCGDDSFTYSASDGAAASAAALVSLTVACTLPDAVFKDGFE